MTNRYAHRGRARIAAEVGYVAACEVLLFVAWGNLSIYLFVLVTLPSSILPFGASAMGWGGMNQLGGGVGGSVITVLWLLTPLSQVALARMALRRRSRAATP